jgi:hypothetical protein
MSSVMICWNTVATTVDMSLRDELFTLGAWTDLSLVVGCASREVGNSVLPLWRARSVQPGTEEANAAVCCCVAPPRRIVLGWCGLEENTLTVVSVGALCDFLFRISSLAWLQSRQLEGCGSSLSTNCSCCMSVSMLHCPFPGTPCVCDRTHTTYSREVACSYPQTWPNCWQL